MHVQQVALNFFKLLQLTTKDIIHTGHQSDHRGQNLKLPLQH